MTALATPATVRTSLPFAEVLDPLVADGRIVAVERRPAVPGRTAPLRRPLPPAIAERLGIRALWAHQVDAVEHVLNGPRIGFQNQGLAVVGRFSYGTYLERLRRLASNEWGLPL